MEGGRDGELTTVGEKSAECRVQSEERGERRADIPVRHFNSYHKRQTRRWGKEAPKGAN